MKDRTKIVLKQQSLRVEVSIEGNSQSLYSILANVNGPKLRGMY